MFVTSSWCYRPQPLPDSSVDCQPSWCIITFLMQRKECEEGGGKYRSTAMQENGCSPRITMSFISHMMNGNATSMDNNFVWWSESFCSQHSSSLDCHLKLLLIITEVWKHLQRSFNLCRNGNWCPTLGWRLRPRTLAEPDTINKKIILTTYSVHYKQDMRMHKFVIQNIRKSLAYTHYGLKACPFSHK